MLTRALEELAVGQHRKARGASAFVAARDRRRVEIGAQHAARGAGALDLGDHRRLLGAQRTDEVANCRSSGQVDRWTQLARRFDLRAFRRDDALEDAQGVALISLLFSV